MSSWTQDDLTRLEKAIASGTRSVRFADGREKVYQNLDQMLAAVKVVRAQLQMQSETASGVNRRRTPYYRSGL